MLPFLLACLDLGWPNRSNLSGDKLTLGGGHKTDKLLIYDFDLTRKFAFPILSKRMSHKMAIHMVETSQVKGKGRV